MKNTEILSITTMNSAEKAQILHLVQTRFPKYKILRDKPAQEEKPGLGVLDTIEHVVLDVSVEDSQASPAFFQKITNSKVRSRLTAYHGGEHFWDLKFLDAALWLADQSGLRIVVNVSKPPHHYGFDEKIMEWSKDVKASF